MNTLVVFDTQFGNTELIARAIAEALGERGPAQAVRVSEPQAADLAGVDLLVLGSPTISWKPTQAVQAYLERIPPADLGRLHTAVFDTRMHLPRLLSRDAASWMAKRLGRMRAEPLLPPEGFFVQGREGPLESGEVERATAWARQLGERYEAVAARSAAG